MTDEIQVSPRSVTRLNVWANCRGINHSDGGEIVVHDRCGQEIVRREDGRLFNVERSGFYQARKFSCYHGQHECDPALVAARTAERTAAAAKGEIDKGVRVEVFKGRKVPVGTKGVVFWMGDTGYGPKLGIRDDEGNTHWTAQSNCRVA